MITETKFQEMKEYAETQDPDVLGVTIPTDNMAQIADTALKLWSIVRAAQAQRVDHIIDHDCFCPVCKSLLVLVELGHDNGGPKNG